MVFVIAALLHVLEPNVYTIAIKTSSISYPVEGSEVHLHVSDVRLASRCDPDRSR